MNTQADYDLMKAVFDKVNSLQPKLGDGKPKQDALRQIRARLFTINLNLRPLLSYQELPQELIDKIHHEALMSELIEKLPAFHERGETFFKWSCYYGLFGSPDWDYYDLYVPNFWRDLFKQVGGIRRGCRTVEMFNKNYKKKKFLGNVLTMNGVECKKSWSVKKLIQEIVKL